MMRVFAISVIDRYQCRPCSLNDMCLAAFAVNYDLLSGSMPTELPDDVPASAGNDHITHEYGKVAPHMKMTPQMKRVTVMTTIFLELVIPMLIMLMSLHLTIMRINMQIFIKETLM